jgi:formylglycine-generating enzyme required for sulfatase activity/predicted Ser/Thr protein kinase
MAATSPDALPQEFGRYRISQRLGQGGMGSVYLALDTKLKRRVALKVATVATAESAEARQRHLTEAQAAASLDHPYLCPVYDVGEIDGRVYLTMAYIEGQTLEEWAEGKALGQPQVAALVGKLALALQQAHSRGVIHRDLKPGNVMMKATGQGQRREPVIVDFGLARREDAGETRLTKSGQVMGTPTYMAPEQIRGELSAIGPACDIYALGVILYELLTGQVPFDGPSSMAVLAKALTQEPVPPSRLRGDLDPRLEAICLTAMAKEASARFATMDALATALTEFARGSSAGAPAAPPTPAPAPPRPAPGGARAPTLLETDGDRLKERLSEAVERPRRGASMWDRPTEIRGGQTAAEEEQEEEPQSGRGGLPPWLWPPIIGGVLLVGFLAAVLGGAFKVKTPDRAKIPGEITNTIGMTLVPILAGEFLMGSPDSDSDAWSDEKPQHRVRITRPFYLGVTEVTQGQYRAVMGQNPSHFRGSDDLPVEMVSWEEAQAFCARLNEQEKEQLSGERYRLPTEAEREYACRAGTTTRFSFGDANSGLDDHGWFGSNSGGQTHPVGQKRPNPWGLFDMHGNVWEWCEDGYDDKYYVSSPAADPPGPSQAAFRVVRGGSWFDLPAYARSTFRGSRAPEFRNAGIGLRVARVQVGLK